MSVNTTNERLARLTALGTSVWLDQIGKGMIDDGDLKRLVDEYSLRGVTSNPSIFEKAILESSAYDPEVAQMASEGLDAMEIYKRIAVKDVKLAKPDAKTFEPPAYSTKYDSMQALMQGAMAKRRGGAQGGAPRKADQ